jgi:hypothetical protein
MTATELFSMGIRYGETLRDIVPNKDMYKDALIWYNQEGGTPEDYSNFIDVVHMWVRNNLELGLSDAILNAPYSDNEPSPPPYDS